jgi:hypothetical protein
MTFTLEQRAEKLADNLYCTCDKNPCDVQGKILAALRKTREEAITETEENMPTIHATIIEQHRLEERKYWQDFIRLNNFPASTIYEMYQTALRTNETQAKHSAEQSKETDILKSANEFLAKEIKRLKESDYEYMYQTPHFKAGYESGRLEGRRQALEEAASLFSCWQPGVTECQCPGCEFPKAIRKRASGLEEGK